MSSRIDFLVVTMNSHVLVQFVATLSYTLQCIRHRSETLRSVA